MVNETLTISRPFDCSGSVPYSKISNSRWENCSIAEHQWPLWVKNALLLPRARTVKRLPRADALGLHGLIRVYKSITLARKPVTPARQAITLSGSGIAFSKGLQECIKTQQTRPGLVDQRNFFDKSYGCRDNAFCRTLLCMGLLRSKTAQHG